MPHGAKAVIVAVSIHAPVKGATSRACQASTTVMVSIHAPVKGATASDYAALRSYMFRSTPP